MLLRRTLLRRTLLRLTLLRRMLLRLTLLRRTLPLRMPLPQMLLLLRRVYSELASWALVVAERVQSAVERSAVERSAGLNGGRSVEDPSAEDRSADELSGKKYNLSYMLCDKLYIGVCRREGERSFSVISKETVN
ncbi:MAG: hypothetical protein EBZ77_17920 [Chitinophagia bacterium]|nr:hypothetical protein [Chitinophagia bacterium]